jgi:hypothetical protein
MSVATWATICLALAVFHTLIVNRINRWAKSFPEGSVGENVLHMLGEVEVVFGLWAAVFIGIMSFIAGGAESLKYLNDLSFREPWFVFVVMGICSTQPVVVFAKKIILKFARWLPFRQPFAFLISLFTIGPLMGSIITEPAAMTLSAILLAEVVFENQNLSAKLKYTFLGLLFVNISIGGTLTHFAAPPVLMVAGPWNWDLTFMLTHFGWRAVISCILSTAIILLRDRKEIASIQYKEVQAERVPLWVMMLHVLFLGLAVLASHHLVLLMPIFLFFLGVYSVTREFQNGIRLREAMLVGFFLGGLVVLGGPQGWWLTPLLQKLDYREMFLGVTALTAFTDNAALTYLGSLVPNLDEVAKYSLVAGSVVGGGLTVIANAPNPAGYGILNKYFGEVGINPLGLLRGALLPTLIAFILFAVRIM